MMMVKMIFFCYKRDIIANDNADYNDNEIMIIIITTVQVISVTNMITVKTFYLLLQIIIPIKVMIIMTMI